MQKKDEKILDRQKYKRKDSGRNKKKIQETKRKNKKKGKLYSHFYLVQIQHCFSGIGNIYTNSDGIFEISRSFEEYFHEEINDNFKLKQNSVESFFMCHVP